MSRDDYYGRFYLENFERENEPDEEIIVDECYDAENKEYVLEFTIPKEIKLELDEIFEKDHLSVEEAFKLFMETTVELRHFPDGIHAKNK